MQPLPKILALQAIAALLTLIGSSPGNAQTWVLANLLDNFNAEAGPASEDGHASVVVPGWEVIGGATVVRYGSMEGVPGLTDRGAEQGDLQMFIGGASDTSRIVQVVTLPEESWSVISNGSWGIGLKSSFGGYLAEDDFAQAELELLDDQDDLIRSFRTSEVVASYRQGETGFYVNHWGWTPLPGNSRRVRLTIRFVRVQGVYNNACADNLSLHILPPTSVVPATWGGIKGAVSVDE